MNNNHIIVGILMVLLLPVALLMGQWSATDPVMAISVTLGGFLLAMVVALERNIWLLIPLTVTFRFPLVAIPGGFALRDIVAGIVCLVLVMIWATRRFDIRVRMGLLEWTLVAQYLTLAQAFFRNPVGLSVLGDSTVGGRPYFEVGVALFVFVMLSVQVVSVAKVKSAARMMFFGGVGSAALEVVSTMVPGVGMRVLRFYQLGSAGSITGIRNFDAPGTTIGRRTHLSYIVNPLFAYLLALTRPLGLISVRRPLIVIGFVIVLAAVLLSGFRSLLAWVGMMYIMAALVRRKPLDIGVAMAGGVVILGIAVVGNNSLFTLPLSVQRTLSFLPGDWDSLAAGDAKSSADWRYEMWETALTSDVYIKNKLVGDGFGFDADDLAFQGRMQDSSSISPAMMQEHFLRSGEFHSGPIQVINRVGYFGLVVLTIGLLIFARYAWVVIRRAEGTDFYVCAMYVGLPMIVYPFFFYLVIGGYQQAIVTMTFGGGMLRLIDNSMDRHDREERRREADQLAATPEFA